MKKRARRGFTLAELLVVVAIIAVLVAIAVPVFGGAMEKARKAVCDANKRDLLGEYSVAVMTDLPQEDWKDETALRELYTKLLAEGQYQCPDTEKPYVLSFDADGQAVVSCLYHDGEPGDIGGDDDEEIEDSNSTEMLSAVKELVKNLSISMTAGADRRVLLQNVDITNETGETVSAAQQLIEKNGWENVGNMMCLIATGANKKIESSDDVVALVYQYDTEVKDGKMKYEYELHYGSSAYMLTKKEFDALKEELREENTTEAILNPLVNNYKIYQ